jgi:putative ABC transport system permease protein
MVGIGFRSHLFGSPLGERAEVIYQKYHGIGSFGLILAAIGLAGVTAYSIARRRKEIGIRMALGFGPSFAAGSRDPRLIFGAPLLLAGLAMLACYVPARRSAKIDPVIALREE